MSQWWAQLSDNAVFTGREIKRMASESQPAGPRIVGTVQAARIVGYSARWWADRCREQGVDGAWEDNGYWRFPLESAYSLVAKRARRVGRRGPRKRITPPDLRVA